MIEVYLVQDDDGAGWRSVDRAGYVAVERRAGFRNRQGRPDEPATASFSNGALRGKTRWLDDDDLGLTAMPASAGGPASIVSDVRRGPDGLEVKVDGTWVHVTDVAHVGMFIDLVASMFIDVVGITPHLGKIGDG